MDDLDRNIARKVMETVTLNSQKGDQYRLAFRGEPDLVYEGIPVVMASDQPDADHAFSLKVLAPAELEGRIIPCSADDVVLLEKIE